MTATGIADALRTQLDLEGYGSAFQVYRDSMPLDEQAATAAIIDAISEPAVMDGYQDVLRHMADTGDNIDTWQAAVTAVPDGLEFEHGDFTASIVLSSGLQVAKAGQRRTRRQERAGERATAIEAKRRAIEDTSEDDYLIHANQCGYLLRNVRLDFLRSPKMQGTSVKMRIRDLTLDQLQRFMDAAGRETLASLSTHEGTRPGSDDAGRYVYSGWIGFTTEIIDFLNLEMVIDIDNLKAQHRDVGGDTGFRPLAEWGGGVEIVIGQLIDRRPDIDADAIREWLMEGYGGEIIANEPIGSEFPKAATT